MELVLGLRNSKLFELQIQLRQPRMRLLRRKKYNIDEPLSAVSFFSKKQ